ncbi:hypothetical protein H6P81_014397 [Aristolochia fimbriata]|uniref:Uncharacterized protein n=1 Tax=Aristolochia fimbriata TaxID=158543 RepID=A0AAV7EIW8_ARIFI|nr:hypothetical protein H6P81_014397 [Aristolochia fimbriata]
MGEIRKGGVRKRVEAATAYKRTRCRSCLAVEVCWREKRGEPSTAVDSKGTPPRPSPSLPSLNNGNSGIVMGWSPALAANAFMNTLKLSKHQEREKLCSCKTPGPESNAFVSALAAGMSAKLLVEVSKGVSCTSIALAAAARETGGRLICIYSESESKSLGKAKQVIKDAGLRDLVEFRVGDPFKILPSYENVDFSLMDCRMDGYPSLLKLLNVNPRRSVVVGNNLVDARRGGLGGSFVTEIEWGSSSVKCTKSLIGTDMEVMMIGRGDEFGRRERAVVRPPSKSKWVAKVDKETGEEHIFRVVPRRS